MKPQVIGISGSPIKHSNTDRLVQAVLENTGLETEFIKLSRRKVQPCIACLGCVDDNVCKVKDDFQEIAEKVKHDVTLPFCDVGIQKREGRQYGVEYPGSLRQDK